METLKQKRVKEVYDVALSEMMLCANNLDAIVSACVSGEMKACRARRDIKAQITRYVFYVAKAIALARKYDLILSNYKVDEYNRCEDSRYNALQNL